VSRGQNTCNLDSFVSYAAGTSTNMKTEEHVYVINASNHLRHAFESWES